MAKHALRERDCAFFCALILCFAIVSSCYPLQLDPFLTGSQQWYSDNDRHPLVNTSQGWVAGVRNPVSILYSTTYTQATAQMKNYPHDIAKREEEVYVGNILYDKGKTSQSGMQSSYSHIAIDSFLGIPYAHPPVGNLRFRKPAPLTQRRDTVFNATRFGSACPQMNTVSAALPYKLPIIPSNFGLQVPGQQSEDCLTINIQRPVARGTDLNYIENKNLPVMVWFYGGGFEIGDASIYDGTNIVQKSAELHRPVIFVSFNYRLNIFGFLPGAEVLQTGDTNVGLRDQELALNWIQENIHEFGGNPDKVTVFGQSAGAMSIAYHLQHLYQYQKEGNRLPFSNVILHSGSAAATNRIDSPRAQTIYNQVAESAGCLEKHINSSLECMRSMPYEELKEAFDKLPFGVISHSGIALEFLPRSDNDWLTQPSQIAFSRGEFAKVPMISGDVDDEGTMFSLGSLNITTEDELQNYLKETVFPNMSSEQRATILELYPQDSSKGSPFGTGPLFGVLTPQNKRIAAIFGDVAFQAPRRIQLGLNSDSQPSWSYISKEFKWTTILGACHSSDLLFLFPKGGTSDMSNAIEMLERWLNFAHNSNPNVDKKYLPWPEYKDCENAKGSSNCQGVILEWSQFGVSRVKEDSFRADQINYLHDIASSLAL